MTRTLVTGRVYVDGDAVLELASAIMEELNPKVLEQDTDHFRGKSPLNGARCRLAIEHEERRKIHSAGAWEFLLFGSTNLPAPDGQPWSRDYNPLPARGSLPADLRMYEGTGIGALYGFLDTERHLWQLAGWNLDTGENA